jgi:ribosome biogenesis GTPase
LEQGRIVKLIGGLYTVLKDNGERIELKARGRFRHQNKSPKVGDIVIFNQEFIHEVLPRQNELKRPPIANVDQAILVNSAKEPNFSFSLLDRFLLLIENEDIRPVLVVTKIDLLSDVEIAELKNQLSYYKKYYDVVYLSGKTKENVDLIKPILKNKVSVLAGQSGAGKSSLLNAIDSSFQLATDEISKALGRGKHTTRHVELHRICNGLVADTPGFSKLDYSTLNVDNVPINFVDFFDLSSECKYRGCTHLEEPGCKVKLEVERGHIPLSRYQSYKQIYMEIKNQKIKY